VFHKQHLQKGAYIGTGQELTKITQVGHSLQDQQGYLMNCAQAQRRLPSQFAAACSFKCVFCSSTCASCCLEVASAGACVLLSYLHLHLCMCV